MKTPGRGIPIVLAIIATCAAASAQNLLSNPSFDTDLSIWLPSNSVVWNSQDADGSPHSGSAKITNLQTNASYGDGFGGPCFPISSDDRYSLGGKFLLPSEAGDAHGQVLLYLYSGANCDVSSLFSPTANAAATGAWQVALNDNVTLTAGAHSARFSAYIVTGSHPSPPLVGYFDDAFLIKGSVTAPCVANDTTLCVNGGRFKVTARWRSHSDSGEGHAESLTADTGTFWFFSSNNVELIVKVVGACVNPFNRYWVFAAGLTNVEVTITVVDTETGEVRTYVNPLDQAFAPIQDTQAFATCP